MKFHRLKTSSLQKKRAFTCVVVVDSEVELDCSLVEVVTGTVSIVVTVVVVVVDEDGDVDDDVV